MSGRAWRYVAGLAVVLGACSGGDDPSAGATTDATTTSTAADPPAVSLVATDVTDPANETDPGVGADDTTAVRPATTVTPAVVTTTTTPPAVFDVGRTVVQTTPISGNAATPLLAWELVDGAGLYTVVVADADGSTWWSWEGAELEVVLGGVASGPAALRTEMGTTWAVFAHGEDGRMLAASPRRALDP